MPIKPTRTVTQKEMSRLRSEFSKVSNDFRKCKCDRCGMTQEQHTDNNRGKLQVHHIVPIKHGGSNQPSNVSTLCYWCHKEYHNYWEFLGIPYEVYMSEVPFLQQLRDKHL